MDKENKNNPERSGHGAESKEEGRDAELTSQQSDIDAIETGQASAQPPKNTGIAIVNLDSDSPEVKEVLHTNVSVDKIKSALDNPKDITNEPWSKIKNMQIAAGGGRRRSYRRKSSNRKRSKSRKGSRNRKGSRRRK